MPPRLPFAPGPFFVLLALLLLLITFIQVGALTLAFDKLGLSPHSALILMAVSLFGSLINLPLFAMETEASGAHTVPDPFHSLLRQPMQEFHGRTLVAINLGGCLVPVIFSLYLIARGSFSLTALFIVTGVVTLVSHLSSRPMRGIGIGMPVFVAPLAAAITAVLVDVDHSAPLAYVGGTLGVLIGADLMRFRDIRKLGAPLASIGGAGTFDGIFITGIVAVLLT
ncbi:MAG TPA: hypothetical protein DIC36_07020 [Gammaproteobacteria bacterium]|nr:hypothetical protein [Gammaproteobacteria bacterium]